MGGVKRRGGVATCPEASVHWALGLLSKRKTEAEVPVVIIKARWAIKAGMLWDQEATDQPRPPHSGHGPV